MAIRHFKGLFISVYESVGSVLSDGKLFNKGHHHRISKVSSAPIRGKLREPKKRKSAFPFTAKALQAEPRAKANVSIETYHRSLCYWPMVNFFKKIISTSCFVICKSLEIFFKMGRGGFWPRNLLQRKCVYCVSSWGGTYQLNPRQEAVMWSFIYWFSNSIAQSTSS